MVLLISFYLIVSNHQKPFLNYNLALTDSLTHAVILFFILLNILMINTNTESSKQNPRLIPLIFFVSSCRVANLFLFFCCCWEISYLLSPQVSCYTNQWDLPPHNDCHNSDSETDESGFHFVCISSATAKKVWEMCSFSVETAHSIGALKEECLKALEVSS